MENKKVLVHTCCAPCVIKCVEVLKNGEICPVLYWYNPNIHPWTEYNTRKTNLVNFAEQSNINCVIIDEYDVKNFILGAYPDFSTSNRCKKCYEMRLENTVKYARENNYKFFTTSLLISPYQNHEIIKEICVNLSQKYEVEFLYRDFREYFRAGQQEARERKIYMQKYCGCIFSEQERYLKQKIN